MEFILYIVTFDDRSYTNPEIIIQGIPNESQRATEYSSC